jgi:hypothetical protein
MSPEYTDDKGTKTVLSMESSQLLTADEIAHFETTGEAPDFNELAARDLAAQQAALAANAPEPAAVDEPVDTPVDEDVSHETSDTEDAPA